MKLQEQLQRKLMAQESSSMSDGPSKRQKVVFGRKRTKMPGKQSIQISHLPTKNLDSESMRSNSIVSFRGTDKVSSYKFPLTKDKPVRMQSKKEHRSTYSSSSSSERDIDTL